MNKLKPLIQQESDGDYETLFKEIVLAYQDACNNSSADKEIMYTAALETLKTPTPDGNRDIAYLRIQKHSRPKGSKDDSLWEEITVHQEIYIFRDMKERVSDNKAWKEQLFGKAVGRLFAAGLEYAEILQNLKAEEAKKNKKVVEPVKSDIVIAKEMPAELSEDDKKYAEYIKEAKAKENL